MLALLGTEFQKKQRGLRRLKRKKRELKHKGHLSLIGKRGEEERRREENISASDLLSDLNCLLNKVNSVELLIGLLNPNQSFHDLREPSDGLRYQ